MKKQAMKNYLILLRDWCYEFVPLHANTQEEIEAPPQAWILLSNLLNSIQPSIQEAADYWRKHEM